MDRTRKIFLVITFIIFIVVVPSLIATSLQTKSERSVQATSEILKTLYDACLASKNTGDLQTAFDKCSQLVSLAPNYDDGQSQLIEIREHLLANYYAAGVAAFNQELWGESVTWFDKVLKFDLSYRDTADLRAEAIARSGTPTPVENKVISSPTREVMPTITPIANMLDILPMEGPVAYYPFNGNSLDESGNGNNGKVNGATLTDDRFGNVNKAYSFDGVNDYIEVSNTPLLDLPNVGTVCAWYLFQAKGGDPNRVIIAKYRSDTPYEDGYTLVADQVSDAFYNLRLYIKDDFTNVSMSTDSPLKMAISGKWIFACLILNNNTVSGYVNGGLIGTGDPVEVSSGNTNPLLIGAGANHSGIVYNHFFGVIDDVRLYNRSLSEDEIQSLYHEGGWPTN